MKNYPILEGSWVYFNKPGDQHHMMMFPVKLIVPMGSIIHNGLPWGGFYLEYGTRFQYASADEVIHRDDPRVKDMLIQQAVQSGIDPQDLVIRPSSAQATKAWEEKYGMGRTTKGATRAGESFPAPKSHAGHEVVQNHAGGKMFNYCRHCKEEVF